MLDFHIDCWVGAANVKIGNLWGGRADSFLTLKLRVLFRWRCSWVVCYEYRFYDLMR